MRTERRIGFVASGLAALLLVSCGGGGTGSSDGAATDTEQNTTMDPEQYTPDQAAWETFETKPFASGSNTSHDPDGVGWLSSDSWEAAKWDGTVYNPETMTRAELKEAICPSGDQRNNFV